MSGPERSKRMQRFTVCTKLWPAPLGTPSLARSVSRLSTAAAPRPAPPAARCVSRMDVTLAPCLPSTYAEGPNPARTVPSSPVIVAHSMKEEEKEEASGISVPPATVNQPAVPEPARRVSSLLVTLTPAHPAPVPTLNQPPASVHPTPRGSQSGSSVRALEVVSTASPPSLGFSRTELVLRGPPAPRPDEWRGTPHGCTLNCVFRSLPPAHSGPVLSISLSPGHGHCRTSHRNTQGPSETRSSCSSHSLSTLPEDTPEAVQRAANPRAWCMCRGQEHCCTAEGDPLEFEHHSVYLRSSELGTSVDTVDSLIKRHEAFEKLLITQEEKVMSLQEQAGKLREEGLKREDASTIQEKLNSILDRRNRIKELSQSRKRDLSTARLLARFN
ncbi:hypothetical protein chiPu_0021942, partial [Chiloscyllium punctatum]|nr:hypothetical protein [Chiloscyllium punctatum]